jgi:hypothetical protein
MSGAGLDVFPPPRLEITTAQVAGDPVTVQRAREPRNGRFSRSVAVPAEARDARSAEVTVADPGDDTYAPSEVSPALE